MTQSESKPSWLTSKTTFEYSIEVVTEKGAQAFIQVCLLEMRTASVMCCDVKEECQPVQLCNTDSSGSQSH